MLSRAPRPRAPRLSQARRTLLSTWRPRQLSSPGEHQSFPNDLSDETPGSPRRQRQRSGAPLAGAKTWKNTRTVYIRVFDSITSPADAFAVVRAVEKQYGSLREFKFLRDQEVENAYQNVAFADFRHPDSLERIPEAGATLEVPRPPSVPDDGGGVSLRQLDEAMRSQDADSTTHSTNNSPTSSEGNVDDLSHTKDHAAGEGGEDDSAVFHSKTIQIEVSRAERPWAFGSEILVPIRKGYSMRGQAFLAWGGFAGPLSPLPSSTPDGPNVDRPHMRAVLAKWKRHLRERNLLPEDDVPEEKVPQGQDAQTTLHSAPLMSTSSQSSLHGSNSSAATQPSSASTVSSSRPELLFPESATSSSESSRPPQPVASSSPPRSPGVKAPAKMSPEAEKTSVKKSVASSKDKRHDQAPMKTDVKRAQDAKGLRTATREKIGGTSTKDTTHQPESQSTLSSWRSKVMKYFGG